MGTILFVLACGTPAGVDPDSCDGNVQLSVSAGLTPEVSWTPDCTVGQLVIDSAPPPPPSREAHFVWFLDSSLKNGLPANRISGPVNYSSRPSGVVVRVEPRPLVPGVHYQVTLVVYGNEGVSGVHSLDFDP